MFHKKFIQISIRPHILVVQNYMDLVRISERYLSDWPKDKIGPCGSEFPSPHCDESMTNDVCYQGRILLRKCPYTWKVFNFLSKHHMGSALLHFLSGTPTPTHC